MSREDRPLIIGSSTGPEPPYPLRMDGKVIAGFGRGSKELGIPTANIPVETVSWISNIPSGVYFGWSSLHLPPNHSSLKTTNDISQTHVPAEKLADGWRIYPMVMSIGYNPFYKNTVRSAEVHVLDEFGQDFYGSWMAVVLLGYIRPELDYVDVESLIRDIKFDCQVARTSLDRKAWEDAAGDGFLWGIGGAEGKEVEEESKEKI
ncbi:riboflavin kinase [Phlyctema vagabunda]|uniref:Riboflavin kinase n=1 Tax=Phlyctema vagabunda TaxID=108571 RepID=A0ABR4PE95_9HELO